MEKEISKLKVNEFLLFLKTNFESLSESEKQEAKSWATLLVAGMKKGLWLPYSSLKEIKQN